MTMDKNNISSFPKSGITDPIAVIAERLEHEFDEYTFNKGIFTIDIRSRYFPIDESKSKNRVESYRVSFRNGHPKFSGGNIPIPADMKARILELYEEVEERILELVADGVGKAAKITMLDAHDRPDAVLNPSSNVQAIYEYPTFFKVRVINAKTGKKAFEPWAKLKTISGVYQWVNEEGEPSLYGELSALKSAPTVFVFEGEKTADAAIMIRDDKPEHSWHGFLQGSAIVAFPGANRWNDNSFWTAINRQDKRVYIVPDNDDNGREAAKGIIKKLDNVNDVRLIDLQYAANVAVGADLADFENECPFDPSDYVNADCALLTATRTVMEGKKVKQVHFLTPWAKQHLLMNQETSEIFSDLNPAASLPVSRFKVSYAHRMPHKAHKSFEDQLEHIDTVSRVSNRPLSFYVLTDITKTEKQKRYNGYDYSTFNLAVNKAKQGNVDVFLQFMEHLIPDESERELVLYWIAMTIIRPDIKLNWHLLLDSTMQGTGKGVLCSFIEAIIGGDNVQSAAEKDLKSRFNSFIEKKFVYFPEMLDADKQKPNALYESAKSLLSDKGQSVERKGIDKEKIDSYTSYIFCSNNAEQAIRFDVNDRRFYVPRVTEIPLEEAGLVKDVVALLENKDALQAIVFYLKEFLERKGVENFPPNSPDSEKKAEMIENSGSYWQRAIRTMVNTHFKNDDGTWKPHNIVVKEVREALSDHCNEKKEYCPSAQKIKQELIVCGFVEPHKAFQTGNQEWVVNAKHPRPKTVKFLMTPANVTATKKLETRDEKYESGIVPHNFTYFPF